MQQRYYIFAPPGNQQRNTIHNRVGAAALCADQFVCLQAKSAEAGWAGQLGNY